MVGGTVPRPVVVIDFALAGGWYRAISVFPASNCRRRCTIGCAASPRTRAFRSIIKTADEPGDRRPASRKGRGREESPDSGRGELERAGHGRATRLVTPGGWSLFEVAGESPRQGTRLRKVPQKIKPPVMLAPRRQARGKTSGSPLSVERIWQG